MITELKRRYGNKCTGVKVNYEGPCVNTSEISLRFCQAVNYSFNVPLLLNSSLLSCKGAQRSFGLLRSDEELIIHIAGESNVPEQTIKRALHDIPLFDNPLKNVFLGIQDYMEDVIHPDMYILQIKPNEAMDLMRQYIVKTNNFPIIKPYPFLSVCGGILAASLINNLMSISFGCPESRKFAGVDESNVIVGIPFSTCNQLFV